MIEIKVLDKHEFWALAFLVSMLGGYDPEDASETADRATKIFKKKFPQGAK